MPSGQRDRQQLLWLQYLTVWLSCSTPAIPSLLYPSISVKRSTGSDTKHYLRTWMSWISMIMCIIGCCRILRIDNTVPNSVKKSLLMLVSMPASSKDLGSDPHLFLLQLPTKASNSMYALNVLRTHGMPAEGLHAVFRAKILSRITYASSAWWGLSSQHDIQRIDSFLKKAVKLNFYPESGLRFVDLCRQADDSLFKNIIKNKQHVLYKMLPQIKETRHDLRKRGHNFVLPSKDDRLFINRTLFRLK